MRTLTQPTAPENFKKQNTYAHMLIVVAFLVVNFFGFLVITRHHGVGEVPGVVEMNRTSLPHLFPPLPDLI